jgi:hypothetical protein
MVGGSWSLLYIKSGLLRPYRSVSVSVTAEPTFLMLVLMGEVELMYQVLFLPGGGHLLP